MLAVAALIQHAIKQRRARNAKSADGADSNGGVSSADEKGVPAVRGFNETPEQVRWNTLAIYVAGAALVFDFTATLMSIQALFYLLQAPSRLYGLTFAAYDITQFLFSPAYGLWADAYGLRLPQLTGILVNQLGNILYAFTVLSKEWYVILIARFISGAGAAVLFTGLFYLTGTTSFEQRFALLSRYRLIQSLARFIGPFLAFAFLGMPLPTPQSSAAVRVFNFYTMPAWLTVLVTLTALVVVAWWFRDPPDWHEHRLALMDEALRQRELQLGQPVGSSKYRQMSRWRQLLAVAPRGTLRTILLLQAAILLMTNIIIWATYSNLYAQAVGHFHLVGSQTDIWKVFAPLPVGVGVATLVRTVASTSSIQAHGPERALTASAFLALFISYMLVIPYDSTIAAPNAWRYYVSTGFLGYTVVTVYISLEVIFSKYMTLGERQTGPVLGLLFSLYSMVGALGRAIGQIVVGSVTHIADTVGTGALCQPSIATSTCCLAADTFRTSTCELTSARAFYAVFAVFTFLTGVAAAWIFWDYNYERVRQDCEVVEAAPPAPSEDQLPETIY
ncbi:hypothetical protein CDCA_CDCA13G3698 [Cyanidium caldarium]|uniref:Major facilitator superfamily (MFS) profile domain-containing protein n=1 Tax=Cyanidium caldarium TaxID=2771 RepID=A0AAV9IZA1_CYACA|nr:hypothetical protein CDCA_CDCA13G3698 [Cyanidium caldarium]